MKKLDNSQMEMIEAGSWLGGFCAILGVGGALGLVLKGAAVVTGVGGAVLTITTVGCAVYGLTTT